VLENLIGNACKFFSKRVNPRIEIGQTGKKDGQTIFFVSDNGVGFEMKYAGRLFNAFQRLHSQNEYPGTGVGLATVQKIIARHGGRIWAQSDPGQGATFYFSLTANK
jgi:light-regulated signal transduction histidine kinase (bacteriophytochrome)